MEELKREQEMRERRNQDRDRQGDSSVSHHHSLVLFSSVFCFQGNPELFLGEICPAFCT